MEIFLDSVDLVEIKKYHVYNVIDGITTNPSLMANSKMDFYDTINSICEVVKGDISVEVASNDFEEMIMSVVSDINNFNDGKTGTK